MQRRPAAMRPSKARAITVAIAVMSAGGSAHATADPDRPLGLNVSLSGGVVFMEDPLNSVTMLRAASAVGVSWAPGGIPGELGLTGVFDDLDLLAVRADLRYFFYKGPIFEHSLALDLDFIGSAKDPFGGGGFTWRFDWKLWRMLALTWSLGADFVTYPADAAPPLNKHVPSEDLPKAFGYILPMSLLGLEARF